MRPAPETAATAVSTGCRCGAVQPSEGQLQSHRTGILRLTAFQCTQPGSSALEFSIQNAAGAFGASSDCTLSTMSSMDARRQQALGLALLALLIILFVLLRRFWSAG